MSTKCLGHLAGKNGNLQFHLKGSPLLAIIKVQVFTANSTGAHLPIIHPLQASVTFHCQVSSATCKHIFCTKGKSCQVLPLCPEEQEGCPSTFLLIFLSRICTELGRRTLPLSHAISSSRNTFFSFSLAKTCTNFKTWHVYHLPCEGFFTICHQGGGLDSLASMSYHLLPAGCGIVTMGARMPSLRTRTFGLQEASPHRHPTQHSPDV